LSIATLCLGIPAEKDTGVFFNTLSLLAVGWAWWSLGLLLWAFSLGKAATALLCVSGNLRRNLGACGGFHSTFSVLLAGLVFAVV
jgi:hypothetical protein